MYPIMIGYQYATIPDELLPMFTGQVCLFTWIEYHNINMFVRLDWPLK